MVTIDCKNMPFDELNRLVKACPDREVKITGALGQRYIGCGLTDKEITITSTPGNALGAYLGGANITVRGNAQDAVGDTMNAGKITVFGRAGDTVGYAMRGGEILIEGDAGFRTGIHMKEYGEQVPAIVIGGKAGGFLGGDQAGGVIVVLGLNANGACPVGAYCATGQYGGKIFIRAAQAPEALPPQTDVNPHADITEILPLIADYAKVFGADYDEIIGGNFVLLTPSTSNIYKRLYCNREV